MSELKPCPFCGGTNVEHKEPPIYRVRNHHTVGCEDCCADAPFTEWNERATPSNVARVIEEMEIAADSADQTGYAVGSPMWRRWLRLLRGEQP